MANVLVLGKGGREHALVWKLKQSEDVDRVYCIPGSDGIVGIANCAGYKDNDFGGIAEFCREMNIELVFPGPEDPLCNGVVDYLTEKGIRVFGPTRAAAKLEGSKVFAKEFMRKYGIPTAEFEAFDDSNKAKDCARKHGAPMVVKADGLAAGKGSIVCNTLEDAMDAVDRIMVRNEFKEAGNQVVIEDFLKGEEASILALTDGYSVKALVSSHDHKPVFETKCDRGRWLMASTRSLLMEKSEYFRYSRADKGPNTGGMGAYAPAPVVTPAIMDKVMKKILIPTIKGMEKEGMPFAGCLYAGLMINGNDVKVLEYNVRFGDPEAQVVLPLLGNDLYELAIACGKGTLGKHEIKNKEGAACCVVMASGGYPLSGYEKGKEIPGLSAAEKIPNVLIFHAGTKKNKEGVFVTNGGRVLGVTGMGNNLEEAIRTAYAAVNQIIWDNEYHREDIGEKALKR